MITFGPVISRRLGKSLGINNIPSRKLCSYSCIYCQVGVTKYYTIHREIFFTPEVIYKEVENQLSSLSDAQVREELCNTDIVSVKVDAPSETVWKKLNRPAKGLIFSKYLTGLQAFKDVYTGKLITETMLV